MAITIYKNMYHVGWDTEGVGVVRSAGIGGGTPTDLSNYYTIEQLVTPGLSQVDFANIANIEHNFLPGLQGGLEYSDSAPPDSDDSSGVPDVIHEYYHLDLVNYTRIVNQNFIYSIVEESDFIVHLDGDELNPGNNKYYGTDLSGVKGWYDLPEAYLDSSGNPIGGDVYWELNIDSIWGDLLTPVDSDTAGIQLDHFIICSTADNTGIFVTAPYQFDLRGVDVTGSDEAPWITIIPGSNYSSGQGGYGGVLHLSSGIGDYGGNLNILGGQGYEYAGDIFITAGQSNGVGQTGGGVLVTGGIGDSGGGVYLTGGSGSIYGGDTYVSGGALAESESGRERPGNLYLRPGADNNDQNNFGYVYINTQNAIGGLHPADSDSMYVVHYDPTNGMLSYGEAGGDSFWEMNSNFNIHLKDEYQDETELNIYNLRFIRVGESTTPQMIIQVDDADPQGDLTIWSGASDSSAGELCLRGGNSGVAGDGGHIYMMAGISTIGNGGEIGIYAGNSYSGNAGEVYLEGGSSAADGNSGGIYLTGGIGPTGFAGGSIVIRGGGSDNESDSSPGHVFISGGGISDGYSYVDYGNIYLGTQSQGTLPLAESDSIYVVHYDPTNGMLSYGEAGGDSLWQEESSDYPGSILEPVDDHEYFYSKARLNYFGNWTDQPSSNTWLLSIPGNVEHPAGNDLHIGASWAYWDSNQNGGNLTLGAGWGAGSGTHGKIYLDINSVPLKGIGDSLLYMSSSGAITYGPVEETLYSMSIEKSWDTISLQRTIFEDFNAYEEGALIGQGPWVPYSGVGIINVISESDSELGNVIGTGTSTLSYAAISLTDLIETADFDITFTVATAPAGALSYEYVEIFFGDSNLFDAKIDGTEIYLVTEDGDGYLENDTPYTTGDVIVMRVRGLNVTMYKNGVIDTDFYLYEGYSFTGSNGEFVLDSPLSWGGSKHIGVCIYNAVGQLDNVGITYNIGETSYSESVHLVNDEEDPGPGMYYGTSDDSLGTKGWYELPAGGDGLWEEDSNGYEISTVDKTSYSNANLYATWLYLGRGSVNETATLLSRNRSSVLATNLMVQGGNVDTDDTLKGGDLYLHGGINTAAADWLPLGGDIYFADVSLGNWKLRDRTSEHNIVYVDSFTGRLAQGVGPNYMMSIEESRESTPNGVTIYYDFEDFIEGQLIGQGRWGGLDTNWEVIDDSVLGKVVGLVDVGGGGNLVLSLPNLNYGAGFNLSFELTVALTTSIFSIYIGDNTVFEIYPTYSYLYIYTENGYGEIENDTAYNDGDVISVVLDGLNFTMYKNGVIDTDWYDYNGGSEDLTGDAGEFVLGSAFNWDSVSSLILTSYSTVLRFNNFGITYNIGEGNSMVGVHLVNDEEDPGPGMYYGTADDSVGEKGWYPVEDIGQSIVLYNNILEWDTVNNYYRPYVGIPVAAGEGMLYNWYAVAVGLGEADDFESYNIGDLAGQGPWIESTNYNGKIHVIAGKYITHDLDDSNDYAFARPNVTLSTDQFAEIVIGPQNTTANVYHGFGVMVRVTENSNGDVSGFYLYFGNDDYYYIGVMVDGVESYYYNNSLGQTGDSPAEGDVIRLEVIGNELRAYLNGEIFEGDGDWTDFIDVTDELPIEGVPGIYSYIGSTGNVASDMIQADIFRYGAIHNIANDGWHVSTRTEWDDLYAYVEESYGLIDPLIWTTYDDVESCNNALGFNVGYVRMRDVSGEFFGISAYSIHYWNEGERDVDSVRNYAQSYEFYGCCGDLYDVYSYKHEGHWVRLVKDSTTLGEGESGTYTGNDGKEYDTICINGKEWVAEDLRETKYRDGTDIALVTDGGDWEIDINGGRCWYENVAPSGGVTDAVFYTGEETPTGTERLNFNGYLYATGFFSSGGELGESIWQKDSNNLITSIEPGCDLEVDTLSTRDVIRTFNIPLSELASYGNGTINSENYTLCYMMSTIGDDGPFGFSLPPDYRSGTDIKVEIIYIVAEAYSLQSAEVQWALTWEWSSNDRPVGTDYLSLYSGDQMIEDTEFKVMHYIFTLDGETSDYTLDSSGFIGCWLYRQALTSGTDPSGYVAVLGIKIWYTAVNAIYW